MSNNTLELAPYDKFFGIIYKTFQNEGKELTPEMQNTVEIYDQTYAAADADEIVKQQEILAPAPTSTSLAAKGQAKLQRFLQQRQEQVKDKDIQSKFDSLKARNEQTEVELEQCHKTLAASRVTELAATNNRLEPPLQPVNEVISENNNIPVYKNDGLRRRVKVHTDGGKRKTKFKRYKKMYNKTSKKYKNKNTSRY